MATANPNAAPVKCNISLLRVKPVKMATTSCSNRKRPTKLVTVASKVPKRMNTNTRRTHRHWILLAGAQIRLMAINPKMIPDAPRQWRGGEPSVTHCTIAFSAQPIPRNKSSIFHQPNFPSTTSPNTQRANMLPSRWE